MSTSARQIRERLPSWWKMRYQDDAAGAILIEAIGKVLDEAGRVVAAARSERHLEKADLRQPAFCYCASLPRICLDPNYTSEYFTDDGRRLNIASTVADFLNAPLPSLTSPELYQHDWGYIDQEKGLFYVLFPYGAGEEYPYGFVDARVSNKQGEVVATTRLALKPLKLWNTFDEFGALLALKRLPGEDNAAYRGRLRTVCRLPAGAHRRGLIAGVARELGLLREYTWPDGGFDFVVPHYYINLETLLVDGRPPDEQDWYRAINSQIVLRGKPEHQGKVRTVTYAYGIELHELGDDEDEYVRGLFDEDGFPTPELIALKEEIDRTAPVKWGYFIWGDAFWDSGGDGFIPNMYDASVQGFFNLR